jgi:redox-sensitive bicupin YhaK (pirin superfamily)
MILRLLGLRFGKNGHADPDTARSRRRQRSEPAGRNRAVVFRTEGAEVAEGQGMRLRRLIGVPGIEMLDPFLLLDWFSAEPEWRQKVGFPEIPHMGIEAVTYVVSGAIRHTDNRENDVTIEAGGVQWMTASGGVVRAEYAEPRPQPLCGYRLWINMPAREKHKPPDYHAFDTDSLPVEERPGVEIVVIAGTTAGGVTGAMNGGPHAPLLLAAGLQPGARLTEEVSATDNAFFVVHDGSVQAFDQNGQPVTVREGEAAVLGPGRRIQLVGGSLGAEILLAVARPLREPVARAGPIVMSSRADVMKALRSYRDGTL